jgi:hypothetical protein
MDRPWYVLPTGIWTRGVDVVAFINYLDTCSVLNYYYIIVVSRAGASTHNANIVMLIYSGSLY